MLTDPTSVYGDVTIMGAIIGVVVGLSAFIVVLATVVSCFLCADCRWRGRAVGAADDVPVQNDTAATRLEFPGMR